MRFLTAYLFGNEHFTRAPYEMIARFFRFHEHFRESGLAYNYYSLRGIVAA